MSQKLFKDPTQLVLKRLGDFSILKNLLTQPQMRTPATDDLQRRIISFFTKDHPHCIAADFNDCQMVHSEKKLGSAKKNCGMYEK